MKVRQIMAYESIRHGISELLRSPSGVFALLCLFAVVGLTTAFPTVMGAGVITAFVSIIVPVLGVLEHLEYRIDNSAAPDKNKTNS